MIAGDDAWFAAKRCGYGSGRPLTWQAWALILGYGLTVAGSAHFVLPLSVVAFLAIMTGATAAFLVTCARKTRGGWRWRCGKEEVAPSSGRSREKRKGAR